ncbi:substrate-binding periplasmic protein [Cognaticolwellia mytili]|uniref:substrate-binding periplasmic protein n=1 Tax=Cognaticolwellia mytili TaxID=1888913 RepID=UPI000A170886|nr:transporter substrate-binding domain-containing protein [Cognaticolwellia mytili]
MLKKFIVLVFLIFISNNSYSQQIVKVVVGLSKPPYVIKESMSGFELELIEQLFKISGKTVEFIFAPYGRSEKMLELDDINAIMTVNEQIFPNNTLLSSNYINYQNVAISLEINNILLPTIADLANYSIASFQLAHKVLGQEFANAVASSPVFTQVSDQEKQLELLLLGRIDVLVMDIKIFLYYLNKLKISPEKSKIKFHHIFPISPYKVAFKKQADVIEFNQALTEFKRSVNYRELIKKYNFN